MRDQNLSNLAILTEEMNVNSNIVLSFTELSSPNTDLANVSFQDAQSANMFSKVGRRLPGQHKIQIQREIMSKNEQQN